MITAFVKLQDGSDITEYVTNWKLPVKNKFQSSMSLLAGISNASHFEGEEYLGYSPRTPFRYLYESVVLITRTSSYKYISQTLLFKLSKLLLGACQSHRAGAAQLGSWRNTWGGKRKLKQNFSTKCWSYLLKSSKICDIRLCRISSGKVDAVVLGIDWLDSSIFS